MDRIFKRKIYDDLLKWKTESRGRTAILIEGARRVGKTTVVKEFARNEYRSFIYIDFLRKPRDIIRIIEDNYGDLDRMFLLLQRLTGVTLYDRNSAVVFDEVQNYAPARQLVKYLAEYGKYDIIETGSLISIWKTVRDISIPSEEEIIVMHPMDFEEYLWAKGDTGTVPFLRESFRKLIPLGPLHRKIMQEYADYMLVGGMPQSVDAFLSERSFAAAEKAKRLILRIYTQDTAKMIGGDMTDTAIFSNIPGELSRHAKTFRPSDVRKGSLAERYLGNVKWLEISRMVNVCRCATEAAPALPLSENSGSFKIYMADTGLLFTAAFSGNVADPEIVYRGLEKGDLNVNRGMFAENMVAQELAALGYRLTFFTFYEEGSSNLHEIDFLISDAENLVPIEVKSGLSGRHVSLDRFMETYRPQGERAYVIHSKDLRVDGDVVYLPIYMTMFLDRSSFGTVLAAGEERLDGYQERAMRLSETDREERTNPPEGRMPLTQAGNPPRDPR